jgi:pimeloyl-ACP methyl ester carboxylesterase
MILVPGLSCDASVFSTFMDRNAAQYTMYAVTLAGNGGSAPLPDPNDPAYEHTPWLAAADAALAALVADRNLDQPVILGHSLGGLLALRCSAEHPGLFRAAVTLDGYTAFPLLTPMTPAQRAAFVDDRLAKSLFASTAGFAARQRISIAGLVTSPQRAKELGDLSAKTPPEVTLRYLLEVTASDITNLLKQSNTPALAITAASGLTPDMTARAESTIHTAFDPTKNITLVVLVNSRHFIQDDAPEALDQSLATFLSHHTPPPRLVITPTTHPN